MLLKNNVMHTKAGNESNQDARWQRLRCTPQHSSPQCWRPHAASAIRQHGGSAQMQPARQPQGASRARLQAW